ncbi:MAG: UPF0149 family protein [Cupriavidus necator]
MTKISQSSLESPNAYLPILIERDDGVTPGNDWAHGFIQGVQTCLESWCPLFNDEDHCGLIAAIMILHYEHDPDPKTRSPGIPAENREELLRLMIHAVPLIYRYLEPYRQAPESMPQSGPPEGLDEPCPCGSGRDLARRNIRFDQNCCPRSLLSGVMGVTRAPHLRSHPPPNPLLVFPDCPKMQTSCPR